ncbi:MAG TPA: hypothetical protein C5S37_12855 [Methanophagales archaeon]|nr:hypothetical protein [Methanophagales archaeon]
MPATPHRYSSLLCQSGDFCTRCYLHKKRNRESRKVSRASAAQALIPLCTLLLYSPEQITPLFCSSSPLPFRLPLSPTFLGYHDKKKMMMLIKFFLYKYVTPHRDKERILVNFILLIIPLFL